MVADMIGLLVLLFPFGLLAFVLFMERVETPLNRPLVAHETEHEIEREVEQPAPHVATVAHDA